MKYLGVFAVITIVLITGCTKSPQQPTHFQIMTSHTWYMHDLVIGGKPVNTACNLSEQIIFNKDSTGNHYYGILCDTSQPQNISFNWYIEDNTTAGSYYTGTIMSTILYSLDIGGKTDSNTTLKLNIINKDTLEMSGEVNGGQNYYAIYTSSK